MNYSGTAYSVRKKAQILFIAIWISCLPWSVAGQNSRQIDAAATVIRAIGITPDRSLDFGVIVTGNTESMFSVGPDSAVHLLSGNLNHLGEQQSAKFVVTGEISRSFSISLPSSALTIVSGNNDSMTVQNWTSSPSGSGRIGSGGTQDIFIGATLAVGANQSPGLYSGIFSVTVLYP